MVHIHADVYQWMGAMMEGWDKQMPKCHIRLKLDRNANKGLITYTATHCNEKMTQNDALNWVCCSLLNQEIAELVQDTISTYMNSNKRRGLDVEDIVQKNIVLSDHANRGIKYFIATRYSMLQQNYVLNCICCVLAYPEVCYAVDRYRHATLGKSDRTEIDTEIKEKA